MAGVSVEELEQRARGLAEAGSAPSPHTVASYRRRWRQWQAFADHHGIAALPADPVHVAAFGLARFRAGVSSSGVAANLSSVGWFHSLLDPPVDDVTALARTVLRRASADGSDRPLTPAPVLSVGALLAMMAAPVRGARVRSTKLIRHLTGLAPRQLAAICPDRVRFAVDGSWVELRVPAVASTNRRLPNLGPATVRLGAGATVLDCPVEAMRALLADATDGVVFNGRSLYQAGLDEWSPYEGAEGTPLRVAARNRAMVAVSYGGALRVEELSQARVEHLEVFDDGYRLVLPVTKTSRDGASQAVVLAATGDGLDPVAALDAWLAVRGDADGPLFANVHHHVDLGRGMTTDEIRSVLRDLAAQVGVMAAVSGHSLRRSWATHAYLRDRDGLGAISVHLRHRRIDTTVRYIEDLAVHLLDPEEILSDTAVMAGPASLDNAAVRDVGFVDTPLDVLVGEVVGWSRDSSAMAPSTVRNHAVLWSIWERWATREGFDVFPADPRAVALFAAARAEEGLAPSTLRNQLRAIEVVHADHGVPTVGFVRLGAELIAGVARTHTPPRRQADTISVAGLEAMAQVALDHAVGRWAMASLRDHLVVCVGYAGGLSPDDLSRARLDHLERVTAGYVLTLPATTRAGRRRDGVLLARRDGILDPVAAIERWQDATGLTGGPLVPVYPFTEPSRALSRVSISARLGVLATRAGVSVRVSGQSLRRSWATHSYEAGLDLLSISRHLRHRSTTTTQTLVDGLTPWPGHAAGPLTTSEDDA